MAVKVMSPCNDLAGTVMVVRKMASWDETYVAVKEL